jgi:PIN domain nuclease of toxin-antitoxin system
VKRGRARLSAPASRGVPPPGAPPVAVAVASRRPGSSSRLLLDAQAWLWWQADDPRLGRKARAAIGRASEVRLSAATAWEIRIKVALGKLALPRDCDIAAELELDGFRELPVTIAHTEGVADLPLVHRDPFDRLLVAQAVAEHFAIVTADDTIGQYPVHILRADE